jgi:alkanesulfonate monooxygenase SsuD/methylene tetrahydromethanopterin reductase-like flavin-dependent oxidoreductase (luciferase family)
VSIQDQIGIGFIPQNAWQTVDYITRADAAGVGTAWTVMPSQGRDTLTLSAAAAVKTKRIKLGTAILPAFTRHPLAIVTQMLALEDLAPGRFRLGIGTSHRESMAPVYGVPFDRPLSRLREYLQVLRPALNEGAVTFSGEFYSVDAKFPYATQTPLLISTLREHAFELAGELSDGAITWLCPVDYLLTTGKPALERGAKKAGRAVPPLIAHVLVSTRTDKEAVRAGGRAMLENYGAAAFYARMFADAGYPLGPNQTVPDEFVDAFVVGGDERAVAEGLRERLERGLDELLISLVPGHDDQTDEEALLRIISRL